MHIQTHLKSVVDWREALSRSSQSPFRKAGTDVVAVHTNKQKQGTCSFSTRASNSLILAWDISDASSSSCLSRCSVPISSVIFLFSSYIRNTKTGDAAGLPGGQVVKALDYRPRGYSNKDFFHLGVYSALPKRVSRCILRVFSPEVYTASFGGDVKPSVPGDLV